MKKRNCNLLWAPLALLAMTTSAASADTIKGKVTDDAGKSVRGALVRATDTNNASGKTMSVYSQKDGQYSIEVPAGTYDVSVQAYGFALKRDKKDTAQPGTINFALTPKWDITQLTGAEIAGLIPNDTEGKLLKSTCVDCHDLAMPIRRRGQTAEEWKNFIPNMTAARGGVGGPKFTEVKLDALSKALEKYYGPNSMFSPDAPPPSRDKVKHPDVPDAVLNATITEWNIPEGRNAMPHSISYDSKNGIAWFTAGGKTGRFDVKTEKFSEFATPGAHTPAIGPDGRAWITLANGLGQGDDKPRLASIDPATNKVEYFTFDGRPHIPLVTRDGKVWIAGRPGIWSFDPETKKFRQYKFDDEIKNVNQSILSWEMVPGEPPRTHRSAIVAGLTYSLGEDSTGKIWGSSYEMGMLVRIDPVTGESKEFYTPNVAMMRSMTMDAHDNVWFNAYYDNKIGKYDIKKGTFTLYQPPSKGSAPYGIVVDKKTGYVWVGDQSAYTLTRFDPATEKFVEYRLPGNSILPGTPGPPRVIDVADDGKVWFTDYWNGKIGVLDTNGASKQLASR